MNENNLLPIITNLTKRFNQIPNKRKIILNNFTEYILTKLKISKEINLTFICTHNSRRSIISQVWAQTAADFFHIPRIKCYSGGTEVTRFNSRAVEALSSAGFKIEKQNKSANPLYLVYYAKDKPPIKGFSKLYSDSFNPQEKFAAIMTCSDADASCPVINGAEARFPINYNDPKKFDDTELEKQKYAESVKQIATEMLFTFSNL